MQLVDQIENRYLRQQRLPEIGRLGQEKINQATVAIVGCGALGCANAEYLARAGVGRFILIDRDIVEFSNLQRQQLFDEEDAQSSELKVVAAKNRLAKINSQLEVICHSTDLTADNAEALLTANTCYKIDVIVDGLDNFETRFILNDIAVKHQIPYVYGGAVSTFGSVYSVLPKDQDPAGKCLKCLFPEHLQPGLSPSCETAGVLGPVIASVAAIQTTQVLKILTGQIAEVSRQLISFDLWYDIYQRVPANRHSEQQNCLCCQQGKFEFLTNKANQQASWLCGHSTIQIKPVHMKQNINLDNIAQTLPSTQVRVTPLMMKYWEYSAEQQIEVSLFKDGRALIRGMDNLDQAQRLYNQLLQV